MKKSIILFFALFLFFVNMLAQPPKVYPLDESKTAWFRDAKFGIFIHWGLYSILEGSYNGYTLPDERLPNGKSWYAEWIQQRLEVPDEVYQALVHQFNPVFFDADKWIREVKNAGAKYFVITAKHHDGFALWDSKVDDFNIMQSPYGKDVIAELVEACKRHGIKYGFYYSHWHDWRHPYGAIPHWKPTRHDDEFEIYWQEKSLPQIKELLQLFDPDLLWFDTWNEESHITEKRRDELIALVRENSGKCLINGRISYYNPGENIDYLEMFDNRYSDKILEKPWQTPATMQHSWGWHAKDFNWKPSTEMIQYLVGNASKGGNYLLNIGPKADGTLPKQSIRRLREIGAWLYTHSEAVYGTKPVKSISNEDFYLTQKSENGKNFLYVLMPRKMTEVMLPIEKNNIIASEMLESSMPVECVEKGGKTNLLIPEKIFNRDCSMQVLKIELKNGLP
ncbi:MAG: alpha-L-fucosidase [Prevotellaceae bacterium]|jgi:alpha-L-fucosidase|nr:alpha-L-fucosidase [Prevotellaceae bacterium]